MNSFRQAIIRLTGLYVLILMGLSLACSVWLYNVAGNELTTISQYVSNSASSPRSGAVSEASLQGRSRILQSLVFFNLFVFGGGTLVSYVLAKRTLRPVQESYQAQADFAADASHELRTPLTALKAELQLAKQKPALSRTEYAKVIHSSLQEVDRLTLLTERLLRLTEPGSSSRQESASLKAALTQTVRSLRAFAKSRNTHIVLPAQDVNLAIHAADLSELLTIVLHNALKYSPRDATVTVGCAQGRGLCDITVTDNGPGIAPQDLPYIFERFYRGQQLNDMKGYGLGLSVAKKITTSVGGDIAIASKLGNGTKVTISIPPANSA